MFCRFGSLLLRRPVAATAWLNDVWTRPVSGFTSCGSASMYVPFSFCRPRHSSTRRGTSWVSASSSSTSAAVETAFVLAVALERRQLQLLEQHLAELLRRADVELDAGQLVRSGALRSLEVALDPLRLRARAPRRPRGSPARSMATSTGISGSSSVSVDAGRAASDSRRSARPGASCSGRSARSPAKSLQRVSRQLRQAASPWRPCPQTSSSVSAL